MSINAISVKNLTKTYKLYNQPIDRLKESLHPLRKSFHKSFTALADVSFEIKRGEAVGIIGRNGSGKSTLLKIITNVLTPTFGKAILNGRISAILELGAGFNREMTGLENIYLSNTVNNIPESKTEKSIKEITDFAEIGEFINQPIKTYSSGMKARLAFAIAVNIEPDILIIDEALSVGDAAFQRKCFAKMEEIRKSGATILFVSHSEGSIVSLCTRAIWLENGVKVLDGKPKLITGLYLKYLNRPIKIKSLLKEYEKLLAMPTENSKIEKVKNFKNLNSNRFKEKVSAKKNISQESFNETLKATSTIEYEQNGAQIINAKVTDLNNNEVNILQHGEEYFFRYEVKIARPLTQVKFGFLLKQKNGIPISGGVYPSAKTEIEELSKNIIMKFKIIINLANGEYFFNAGVKARVDDELVYVHRIIDVYMIKVINNPPNMTSVTQIIQEANYEELQ